MKISLIAAMANNRVIGLEGKMPWHIPLDLKRVKSLTLGKAIIMGRKTFDSIGKALPGRHNIVITRQTEVKLAGAIIVNDLDQALAAARQYQSEEAIIFGGAQIYKLAMPKVEIMYLTRIDKDFAGDTFFPAWDDAEWQVVSSEDHIGDDFIYHFITVRRNLAFTPDACASL